MDFEFVFIYRHIYRKLVLSVDSKCRNTVILTGLTYTSSQKVFHNGCAKRGIFSHQKFNKNRLSLAHCALNRSFTVFGEEGELHTFMTLRALFFILYVYKYVKYCFLFVKKKYFTEVNLFFFGNSNCSTTFMGKTDMYKSERCGVCCGLTCYKCTTQENLIFIMCF